jgi:hypothetical protein
MKQLIVAGALVALVASPALAQTNHKTHVNARAKAAHASAAQPSAAQPMTDNGMTGGPNGQLIWGGKLRAQDPDAFIRGSILRGMGNYGGD